MCLAFVPFDDRATALGVRRAAARRGAPRPGARATRTASTCRPSSTWTRAASRCCARTAPTARTASRFLPTRDGAARHARAAAGHDERPAPSTRSAARASRRRPTRRSRFCRRSGRGRRPRRRSRSPCPATRARGSNCSRCARRCRRPSMRASARAKHDVDARIAKTAADMIVPFDRLDELMTMYDEEIRAPRPRRRGLGTHLRRQPAPERHPAIVRRRGVGQGGDPGIRPRGDSAGRVAARRARRRTAIRSSSSCSRSCTDEEGIDEMRAVKRALDPEWKLAPGVLFPRQP